MIVLENITKEYEKGIAALDDVSLKIDDGEFVYLMGHSGAGKSTLTRLLLKEIEPTEGKILLNGKDITYVSRRRVPYIRRYIGTIFQDFRILEQKTVYENVAFALEILGVKRKEIRRRVPIILSLVGLSDKAKNFPNELSGGEKQRVAIARAIINEPHILIADEPTGNLDFETSLEIMQVLTDINNRGTTILMATHAKDIVKLLPHRVVVLKDGKVVTDTANEGEEVSDIDKHDVDYGNQKICEIDELTDEDKADLKEEVFSRTIEENAESKAPEEELEEDMAKAEVEMIDEVEDEI